MQSNDARKPACVQVQPSGIRRVILATTLAASAFWLAGLGFVRAANIEGAWTTDAAACSKIYLRSGKTISFAKKADLYGSGFIITGNKIRGKMATCNITARKEEGATVHLVAVCSTDIAIDTVQFTLNIIDNNKVLRMFPGMPDLQTPYERCPY